MDTDIDMEKHCRVTRSCPSGVRPILPPLKRRKSKAAASDARDDTRANNVLIEEPVQIFGNTAEDVVPLGEVDPKSSSKSKRGRGRPRKAPNNIPSPAVADDEYGLKPNKRGRSKKTAATIIPADADDENELQPKKRGRAKKTTAINIPANANGEQELHPKTRRRAKKTSGAIIPADADVESEFQPKKRGQGKPKKSPGTYELSSTPDWSDNCTESAGSSPVPVEQDGFNAHEFDVVYPGGHRTRATVLEATGNRAPGLNVKKEKALPAKKPSKRQQESCLKLSPESSAKKAKNVPKTSTRLSPTHSIREDRVVPAEPQYFRTFTKVQKQEVNGDVDPNRIALRSGRTLGPVPEPKPRAKKVGPAAKVEIKIEDEFYVEPATEPFLGIEGALIKPELPEIKIEKIEPATCEHQGEPMKYEEDDDVRLIREVIYGGNSDMVQIPPKHEILFTAASGLENCQDPVSMFLENSRGYLACDEDEECSFVENIIEKCKTPEHPAFQSPTDHLDISRVNDQLELKSLGNHINPEEHFASHPSVPVDMKDQPQEERRAPLPSEDSKGSSSVNLVARFLNNFEGFLACDEADEREFVNHFVYQGFSY